MNELQQKTEALKKEAESVRKTQRVVGIGIAAVFLVVVIVIAAASSKRSYNNDYAAASGYSMSEDMKAALWSLAQKAVESELKAPSTAKFPASYGSADVSFGKSGGLYTVSAWVDAQNGFGAVVRTNFTVYAAFTGSSVKLDHVVLYE